GWRPAWPRVRGQYSGPVSERGSQVLFSHGRGTARTRRAVGSLHTLQVGTSKGKFEQGVLAGARPGDRMSISGFTVLHKLEAGRFEFGHDLLPREKVEKVRVQ